MLHIEVGGVLVPAARTDSQLIDFVVPHMDKALRTGNLDDFVDNVEDNAVAFLKRGAVAMGVKLVRSGVFAAGVFNGMGAFLTFGNFGMGVGDVLNVTEALYLWNDFKAKVSGVIEKLPYFTLFQKLTARDPIAMGKGRLPAFAGARFPSSQPSEISG